MKSVALALGLSADASEEAVLAAVIKVQTDSTAFKNRSTELETQNQKLLGDVVDADLVKHAKRIKPEGKGAWRKALLANRADALALLEGLPEQAAPKPVHNRESATPPEQNAEGEDPAKGKGGDLQQHPFMNRVREVAKEQKIGMAQAIDVVARTQRDLYNDYCAAIMPEK